MLLSHGPKSALLSISSIDYIVACSTSRRTPHVLLTGVYALNIGHKSFATDDPSYIGSGCAIVKRP